MNSDRLQLYLDRMVGAASRAIEYAEGMQRSDFASDRRTQDAVIANIAAIGECVTKIMDMFPDFVARHAEIPWQDIRAMRNRVAHQYFDMDVDTLWYTVSVKIPELRDLLAKSRA